jgi:hypothetical protein
MSAPAAPPMSPLARAQRAHTLFLKRMQYGLGEQIAEAMSVSTTTLSELKTKHMEKALLLLAHLNLKVVDVNTRCLSPAQFALLIESHEKLHRIAPHLAWSDDEAPSGFADTLQGQERGA